MTIWKVTYEGEGRGGCAIVVADSMDEAFVRVQLDGRTVNFNQVYAEEINPKAGTYGPVVYNDNGDY